MRSPGTDRALSIGATVLFSFALGTLGVVVPLLAIGVGYSAPEVGLMVALAAVSQLVTRLFMGALMRRVPDKAFLVGSAVMIAVSCVLLALSDALVIFAVSQLVQGSARALFWTSSQTHAVRMSATSVGGLTAVNLAAGVGALLGPALAGYLWEASAALPLVVAAAAGAAAAITAALLVRLPLFAPEKSAGGMKAGRLWRRPGVGAACWMNAGAGAWKSLLDSYVPVALSLAGQSVAVIGILISIANTAVLAGSAAGSWLRRKGVRASLVTGLLATGAGLAAAGPLAGVAAAAAVALVISGIGAGILQTVGPAIAVDEVHPEERGDVLALTGTVRASALFFTPFGMALLVTVAPVAAALLAAGVVITLPAACGVRHTEGRAASPRGAATTGPFHPFATRTPESSREEGIR
ncbi:MFS transporter [Pseudarthrobacter sp. MDT3-26]|uniref:MFS transporter n=1 Tax=Pseudarthrobacter raffinosi TaxID=2953651 RepID=UPI00208F6CC1|nr:MFS transporter [Pseudarthrobacter sp. MDT3-26]MCO4264589.1 MFS transporter [Pseudarthrobacter sp. MDT3-26]